jgi:hypothetical protein
MLELHFVFYSNFRWISVIVLKWEVSMLRQGDMLCHPPMEGTNEAAILFRLSGRSRMPGYTLPPSFTHWNGCKKCTRTFLPALQALAVHVKEYLLI